MKLFEIETLLEAIDYWDVFHCNVGDPLEINVESVYKIGVLHNKKLIGYLPEKVALEMTFHMDHESFVQAECVRKSPGLQLWVCVKGYRLRKQAA